MMIGLIYIMGGCAIIESFANPVNDVVKALEKQEYSEAIAVFNENIDEDNIEKLETELLKRLDTLKNDFKNGKAEYKVAEMELNTIRGFNINNLKSKIDEIDSYINVINDSRAAFATAETLFANGNYADAIEYYNLISGEDSNYAQAMEGVSKSISEYKKSVLNQADELTIGKNYDLAINILDIAAKVVGNDGDISSQREIYIKQIIDGKIISATELALNGNYTNSLSDLNLLQSQYPGDIDIKRAVSDIESRHVESIITQVRALIAENKFNEASGTLNNTLLLYSENISLNSLFSEVEASHVENILSQARTLITGSKYSEALILLNDGLSLYPSNTILNNAVTDTQNKDMNNILSQAVELARNKNYEEAVNLLSKSDYYDYTEVVTKITEYTSYLPTWLDEMTSLSLTRNDGSHSLRAWNQDPNLFDRDNLGNGHSHGVEFRIRGSYRDESKTTWIRAEYFLDKNFSLFEGVLTLNYDDRHDTNKFTLRIYLDDVLSYTSPTITTGVLPVEIALNVTNVTKIAFYFEYYFNLGSYYGTTSLNRNIQLVDAAFSK